MEELIRRTEEVLSPEPSVKLEANVRIAAQIEKTSLVGKIVADRVINKNAVRAIYVKLGIQPKVCK